MFLVYNFEHVKGKKNIKKTISDFVKSSYQDPKQFNGTDINIYHNNNAIQLECDKNGYVIRFFKLYEMTVEKHYSFDDAVKVERIIVNRMEVK